MDRPDVAAKRQAFLLWMKRIEGGKGIRAGEDRPAVRCSLFSATASAVLPGPRGVDATTMRPKKAAISGPLVCITIRYPVNHRAIANLTAA